MTQPTRRVLALLLIAIATACSTAGEQSGGAKALAESTGDALSALNLSPTDRDGEFVKLSSDADGPTDEIVFAVDGNRLRYQVKRLRTGKVERDCAGMLGQPFEDEMFRSVAFSCSLGDSMKNVEVQFTRSTGSWIVMLEGCCGPVQIRFERRGGSLREPSSIGDQGPVQAWDGTFNGFTSSNAYSLRVLGGLMKLSVENPYAASGHIENVMDCEGRWEAPAGRPSFAARIKMTCAKGPPQLTPFLTYNADMDAWILTPNAGAPIKLSRTARVPLM